jgi:hypothetical protein
MACIWRRSARISPGTIATVQWPLLEKRLVAKLKDLLVLKYPDFRNDVANFFRELNDDSDLQRLFFENPTLVMRTKLRSLGNVDLDSQQDERANKLLFSALSNERFMSFLAQYQRRKVEAVRAYLRAPGDREAAAELDQRRIKREIAQALLEFGDAELVYNLIGVDFALDDDDHNGHIYFLVYQIMFIFESTFLITQIQIVIMESLLIGEPDPEFSIRPSELRRIAEQLAAVARRKRADGELAS